MRALVEDADVRVLEGDSVVVDVNGRRGGVAGAKGFRGGSASDFGRLEMKAFIWHTIEVAPTRRPS